jgi:uroporphyrinogen decarboxylase
MNKITRVKNAFAGKPVDRAPGSLWFHFTNPSDLKDNCVQPHLDYYHECGLDFVKIMNDGYNYPMVSVKTIEDWKKVRPADKNDPYFTGQIERAKRISDALKGDCMTFFNVFSPFSDIRNMTDEAMVMAHFKENEELVIKALEIIAEDKAWLARKLITEGGCNGIYLALKGGERSRFTPEEHARRIAPSDLITLKAANELSNYNICHLCSGWQLEPSNLKIWKNYPTAVFNWAVFVENLSLPDGKAFFEAKSVMGGLDNKWNGLLCVGSEAEIKAEVKRLVAENGLGFILSADCTIPTDINRNRIRWAMEALAE